MNDTSIHLHNVDDDDDDAFPVTVYTDIIPRVGDEIYYWVDYPTHLTRAERGLRDVEDGEPQSIGGIVERVVIEYRKMDYGNPKNVTMVGVYLKDYTATLYPKEPTS